MGGSGVPEGWRYAVGEARIREAGRVVRHGEGLFFLCPCGEEQLNVGPQHLPSIGTDGTLTLGKSATFVGDGRFGRYTCHIVIKNGAVTHCSDATCPGARAVRAARS